MTRGEQPEMGDTLLLAEDNGQQIVRLPEGYRFDAKEVTVRRKGASLVLEPVVEQKVDEWAWLDDLQGFSDDMVETVLNDRPGLESYERPDFSLDK